MATQDAEYFRRYYRSENGQKKARDRAAKYARHCEAAKENIVAAMGGKCQRCGFDDARSLQFHHPRLNGGDIRRLKHRANKRQKLNQYTRGAYYVDMLAEYLADPSSIVMLCANCHIITHDELNKANGIGKHRPVAESTFGESWIVGIS